MGNYGSSRCPFCGGSKSNTKNKSSKAGNLLNRPSVTNAGGMTDASSSCKVCKKQATIATSKGNFCSSACRAKPSSITVTQLPEALSQLLETFEQQQQQEEEEKEEEVEVKEGNSYLIFGQEPDLGAPAVSFRGWYRKPGERQNRKFIFKSKFFGRVLVRGKVDVSNEIEIAYTLQGDKGPIVVLLPGVPVNRYEFKDFQALISPFCRTIAIDPLGMGQSSMVLNRNYMWKSDTEYIHALVQSIYPDEKYNLFGNDWGGGMVLHTAAQKSDAVLSVALLNPVYSTNYPVPEIQAVGRLKPLIEDDWELFKEKVADFDSRVITIVKDMVHNRHKINQASQRALLVAYSDQDYEQPHAFTGNLTLKYWNIAALAERAYVLSPNQLRPMDSKFNPDGLDVASFKNKPFFIAWGKEDDMMTPAGAHRLPEEYELDGPYVIHMIENARHLTAIDQPLVLAEKYLDFLKGVARQQLADAFLGYPDVPKGDELAVLPYLRLKHGLNIKKYELWN